MSHEYENDIICPYCNYKFTNSWEYNNCEADEDIECLSCAKAFNVSSNPSITYSSFKKACKGEHEWEQPITTVFDQAACNRANDRSDKLTPRWKPYALFKYNCKNCDESKQNEVPLSGLMWPHSKHPNTRSK